MSKASILVSLRKRAGVDTVYPECDTARLFCRIAQTDVLTQQAIKGIKELGFVVNVKQIGITHL